MVLSCSLLAAVYTTPPLMCCGHGWQLNAVCVVESVAFVALQQQYLCISLVADFAAQQVVADGVFGVCGKSGVADCVACIPAGVTS